jgi:hypothetical protein
VLSLTSELSTGRRGFEGGSRYLCVTRSVGGVRDLDLDAWMQQVVGQ